jgi:hypothetical protein
MKIIGKWLPRVDTPEGREQFKKKYSVDYYEYMIEHEVTSIKRLFYKNCKFIVILESDNTFNQVFVLEEQDHVMVYSEGCLNDKFYFNTDGMAFMSLVRDCEKKATWFLENSPYDHEEDDWEEPHEPDPDEDIIDDSDMSKEGAFKRLRELLITHNINETVTDTNVIFVNQL